MSKAQKIKNHKISKIEQLLKENDILIESLIKLKTDLFRSLEDIEEKIDKLEAKEFLIEYDSEVLGIKLQEIIKND